MGRLAFSHPSSSLPRGATCASCKTMCGRPSPATLKTAKRRGPSACISCKTPF